VPESIIPSADAIGPFGLKGISFQMLTCHAVLLPESFRGGCSFGAGPNGPVSPDVTSFNAGTRACVPWICQRGSGTYQRPCAAAASPWSAWM